MNNEMIFKIEKLNCKLLIFKIIIHNNSHYYVSYFYINELMSNILSQKSKATDLKRIMQQACRNTNQTSNTQQIVKNNKQLIYSKIHPKQSQVLKPKQSQRLNNSSNSNHTKQLNSKIGLSSCQISKNNSFKGKENQIIVNNKLATTKNMKLNSSVVLKEAQNKNTNLEKSLKNLKLNSSTDSIKSLKKNSSNTIISQQKKTKKLSTDTYIKQNQPSHIRKISHRYKQSTTFINKKKLCLQDFRLGRKLGKGKFGNVYMCQHIHTKFILAIKIVNIKQLKESEMENQLIQEIKLQTFMNHPNLLKMYGFFSDTTNIYLLLQLGSTCLFKELRHKKYYSEQQAAYYIKQVIESLKYMHSENIIHRDIKPENILISSGVVKLSDFGWSIYSPIHKRQTFCGTLDYVSPEIVQGQDYDQKVDIWSLGVLCYELATGKAPFQVQNDQQRTYDKILSVQIKFPTEMSEQLKDLISKILIKEPKQRLRLLQIQNHPWLMKHSKVGRFISKQIWQSWESMK